MNKFNKLTGVTLLGIASVELVKNFNSIKSKLTKDRQLINRLIEQVKDSKRSLSNLISSLNKLNLSKVNHQINNFNDEMKPHLNQIQINLKKLKKNH